MQVMRVMAVAVTSSVAFLPVSRAAADDGGRHGSAVQLNPQPQVNVPATINGQATNLAFTMAGFAQGNNNAVCAVGTLRSVKGASGPKLPPMQVAFPMGNAAQADCAGLNGDDDREDEHGGFGVREQKSGAKPALYTKPWSGAVQKATYNGSAPFIVPAQVCQIVNLALGPIHLNVLGLVVDTNRILVNITGDPALGLLGNLLCSLLGP